MHSDAAKPHGFSLDEAEALLESTGAYEQITKEQEYAVADNEEEEEEEEEEEGLGESEAKVHGNNARRWKLFRNMSGGGKAAKEKGADHDIPHKYPPGYDPEIARLLVAHSSAAYCQCHTNTVLAQCGCRSEDAPVDGFAYRKRAVNDQHGASAFCGFDPEHKVVIASFRGTDSLTNWLSNFQIRKDRTTAHDFPDTVGLHHGFWKTYRSIRQEMPKNWKPQYCIKLANNGFIYPSASTTLETYPSYNDHEPYQGATGWSRLSNSTFNFISRRSSSLPVSFSKGHLSMGKFCTTIRRNGLISVQNS